MLFAIEHRSAADLLPMASAAGDASAAISGVDHVVVNTTDPDATSALYGEKLGLRLALDRTFPGWGMRLMFFRVGGITVEVAAPIASALVGSGARRLIELEALSQHVPIPIPTR